MGTCRASWALQLSLLHLAKDSRPNNTWEHEICFISGYLTGISACFLALLYQRLPDPKGTCGGKTRKEFQGGYSCQDLGSKASQEAAAWWRAVRTASSGAWTQSPFGAAQEPRLLHLPSLPQH